jgi:ABC-2 type transport system permease protein
MSTESVGSDTIEQLEGHRPLSPPHLGQLRDVSGPSALGGGWRRGLELLYLIASTDFKRAYFGTELGYLWTIGRPLMLFAVLLVVFTKGLHLGNGVPHYPVLLLLNIVLFGFFTEGAGTALPSIVSAEAIVRKTQFPRLVIPLSVVLTAAFNLSLNLVVVFAFILGFGITPMWTWLLLPVLVAALVLLAVAVSMLLSSLYPRFRDVAIIWTVISTALFYASPVLYPLQKLHGAIQTVVALNPLTPILELARRWLIDPRAPVSGGVLRIAVPVALYVAIVVLAAWVFNREAPRIAEAL